jgi:signal transduction histidine kinase
MKKKFTNILHPVITLALLYFISGKISLLFLHGNSIVNIGIFAAEGIALGFILYYGKRMWSGIFIGQFLLAVSNDISIVTSLSIASINSIEALIGYYLFQKFNLNIRLISFRDIFGLAGIIFLIQLFSASASNTILLLDDVITANNFLESSFSWWFGNIMGQLLITPFILLLFVNYKNIDFSEYFYYILFFFFYIYFIEILLNITNPMLLLSLSLPFIIFIISYKNFLYGLTLNVVLALISSYSVYLEKGAFHSQSIIDNVINYNLLILAHISLVFVTGILFEERRNNILKLEGIVLKEQDKNREQEILLLKQSRLAQMGEMIAMIAHQWRQPLNNLSLSNQLLISKYNKGKLNDNTMEMFKKNSKKQITHMSKTIDDFRNFFKPEQKKQEFNVNGVINDLMHITDGIYDMHNIKLTFTEEEQFFSNGYPNELGQAILNIINNAKDALLETENSEKFIKISLKHREENILISIEDNAGGIPQNIADKIFDPYFSTKESKNGTGLGLYMTKMIIIDKLNGEITFSNTEDGVRFEILIKEKTDAS